MVNLELVVLLASGVQDTAIHQRLIDIPLLFVGIDLRTTGVTLCLAFSWEVVGAQVIDLAYEYVRNMVRPKEACGDSRCDMRPVASDLVASRSSTPAFTAVSALSEPRPTTSTE
jgi:hypothetical protein